MTSVPIGRRPPERASRPRFSGAGEPASPRSLLQLADLATPMAIRVAATLELVEHAGEGATAQRLAADTGTDAGILVRLLDHLVTVGVFELDADRYRPTALGAQMATDSPEGIRPLLDIAAAGGRSELAFVELLTTVTTGETAYARRYGREFWDDLDAHPALRRSFDAQMNWRFRTQAAQIATGFDWSRYGEVLDVGGGDGQLLVAILQAHRGIRGRVVELAPTAAAAGARFAAAELGDRAGVVSGSFFDPLPTGADAYLLSDVLHDWDDEHARAILVGCAAAAGPGGTVVVSEALRTRGTATAMDLHLLMCFGGHERTLEELQELAEGSGLALRSTTRVSSRRTALEFAVDQGQSNRESRS